MTRGDLSLHQKSCAAGCGVFNRPLFLTRNGVGTVEGAEFRGSMGQPALYPHIHSSPLTAIATQTLRSRILAQTLTETHPRAALGTAPSLTPFILPFVAKQNLLMTCATAAREGDSHSPRTRCPFTRLAAVAVQRIQLCLPHPTPPPQSPGHSCCQPLYLCSPGRNEAPGMNAPRNSTQPTTDV